MCALIIFLHADIVSQYGVKPSYIAYLDSLITFERSYFGLGLLLFIMLVLLTVLSPIVLLSALYVICGGDRHWVFFWASSILWYVTGCLPGSGLIVDGRPKIYTSKDSADTRE